VVEKNFTLGHSSFWGTLLTQGWAPQTRWHQQSLCSKDICFPMGCTKWGTLIWAKSPRNFAMWDWNTKQKKMFSFTVYTVSKGNPHTTVDNHSIAKSMVKRRISVLRFVLKKIHHVCDLHINSTRLSSSTDCKVGGLISHTNCILALQTEKKLRTLYH
jgi:hypothetical protein